MRGSDDNNAADQQGQDECHRLLKALVNSEAGPGFCCLLKQAKANSATCFAFRVDLSAHGSLNPIVTFELGLWVELKKSGGGAGRYLFGSPRLLEPRIFGLQVRGCAHRFLARKGLRDPVQSARKCRLPWRRAEDLIVIPSHGGPLRLVAKAENS